MKEVTAPLEQVMVKLSELTEADAAEWSAWARAQNVLPLAQWQRMTKSDLVALDTVLTDIWRVLVGADGFHCLKQYLDIAVNPQRTLRARMIRARQLCEVAIAEWFAAKGSEHKRQQIAYTLALELNMNDPEEFGKVVTLGTVTLVGLQQGRVYEELSKLRSPRHPPSRLVIALASAQGAWPGVTAKQVSNALYR